VVAELEPAEQPHDSTSSQDANADADDAAPVRRTP
jgi:hypothetical protein